MLYILPSLAAAVFIGKVADSEGRSTVIWGALTFALCFTGPMIFPFPFLSVIGATVAAFVLLALCNVIGRK